MSGGELSGFRVGTVSNFRGIFCGLPTAPNAHLHTYTIYKSHAADGFCCTNAVARDATGLVKLNRERRYCCAEEVFLTPLCFLQRGWVTYL